VIDAWKANMRGIRVFLRRLAEHVKAQNWTAVALDFIIVVVGILIAFQITAWGEQRADRAKEALYLSELVEDLNADLIEIGSIKRTAEIRMGALERILALTGIEPRRTLSFDGDTHSFDPAPPFKSDDPYEANIQLTNTPDLDGSRETFQALISTGDLGLIRNRALARQIQTYYAGMTEANNLEGAALSHAAMVKESRLRLGVSLTGRVTVEELGALASRDSRFRAELETYWTGSAYQVRAMQSMRRTAEALIAAIKAEQRR
jgi:hypothetical protein